MNLTGFKKISESVRQIRSLFGREAKDTTIYTLSTFLTSFCGFLIIPLFWKKLTPADFGVIAVSDIAGAIIAILISLSLDSSITRFYYEWSSEERKEMVGTLWMLSWLSHVIFGTLFMYIIFLTSKTFFPSVEFYPYIFLGLIWHILMSLMSVPLATLRIMKLPVLYSAYNFSIFLSRIVLGIIFVLILDKKLYGYFVGNVVAGVLTVLLGNVVMFKLVSPSFKGQNIISALKFSLPIIPSNLIYTTSNHLDKFILQQYASLEILGIYAISSKFAGLILILHSAFKLSFVPYMVETFAKFPEKAANLIAKTGLFYLVPIFVLGIAISAFVGNFIYIFNLPQYNPVIQWVPLLILPAIISTFNIYFAPGLFLSKRTDKMWIPRIIQLLSILLSGLILIPLYQKVGIIVTRYISASIFFAVSFVFSKKYYPLPINWNKAICLFCITIFFIILTNKLLFDEIIIDIGAKIFMIISAAAIFAVITFGKAFNNKSIRE